MNENITESARKLIEPVLNNKGFKLVDIEYRREQAGWILRIYIDRKKRGNHETLKSGITLDDCAIVSRDIETILDVESIIPYSYHLEVSSPGITRPLKKEEDFLDNIGKMVKIKCFGDTQEKQTFSGRLLECVAGNIKIKTDNITLEIPLLRVIKANLLVEF